jgi:hypothetical protein
MTDKSIPSAPKEPQFILYQTEDGELSEVSTCKEYLQVQNEGTRKVNRN